MKQLTIILILCVCAGAGYAGDVLLSGKSLSKIWGTDASHVRGHVVASYDTYTKLLLHCDGSQGAANFFDSSYIGRAVTNYGTARFETGQKKFGTSSAAFTNGQGYLDFADSPDFSPGTGAFTIDFWLFQRSYSSTALFDMRLSDVGGLNDLLLSGGWGAENRLILYGQNLAPWPSGQLNAIPPTNEWVHIAVVGDGGPDGSRHINVYMNGAISNGVSVTSDYDLNRDRLLINANESYNPGYALDGYIDEFRFSKGVQRWTNDFTPPTQAY